MITGPRPTVQIFGVLASDLAIEAIITSVKEKLSIMETNMARMVCGRLCQRYRIGPVEKRRGEKRSVQSPP